METQLMVFNNGLYKQRKSYFREDYTKEVE